MDFFSEKDALSLIPLPDENSNKYTRGVAGIIAGSPKFPGAGALACKGGLRSGAGMCRYVGGDSFCESLALNGCPEIVLGEGKCDSFLVGSGMQEIEEDERFGLIRRILNDGALYRGKGYLVLDAQAMRLAPEAAFPAFCAITPHAGELQRLLSLKGKDASPKQILAEPVRHARLASGLFSCAVLLKGSRSVAALGSHVEEVRADCHYLASAGAGDVLAGFLAGFLALTKPGSEEKFVKALAAAALLHNLAGKIASKSLNSPGHPITASDVASSLPDAYLAIQKDRLIDSGPQMNTDKD